MNQPQQNKLEIAVLKANHKNMKDDIREIKSQVSNHIPTAIEKLRTEMNKRDREQEEKINQALIKIAGITSVIFLIVQLLFFFINK